MQQRGGGQQTGTKGKRKLDVAASLLLDDEAFERQRALLRQQQKKRSEGGVSSSSNKDDNDNDPPPQPQQVALKTQKTKKDRETDAAHSRLYPVYLVTPSWDTSYERAQKLKGNSANALLNPTDDEAHDAEQYGGRMSGRPS
jgi:hypothetical protein